MELFPRVRVLIYERNRVGGMFQSADEIPNFRGRSVSRNGGGGHARTSKRRRDRGIIIPGTMCPSR